MNYYSSEKISKENANINLILSERSKGKSYDIKMNKGILHYLKTGKKFIYLRRKDTEIKGDDVEQYFKDIIENGTVEEVTNGKYKYIGVYRRGIYFANFNEKTGRIKCQEQIGYVRCLSTEQNSAGQQFPDVDNIIFEEFVSRDLYLKNEPDKLFNFYCTVDRKKGTTKMWLLGNTISRICPYIRDWGLMYVVERQKQGTIMTSEKYVGKDEHGKDMYVKIAVELCAPSKRTSFTFGQNAEMMNTGKWQTLKQPHLDKSYNDFIVNFRIVFKFKGFKFLAEFLTDKKTGNFCWFIRPKYTEIKKNTIVISDEINISPYYQRNIYDVSIEDDRLHNVLSTFRENCIFYATDLVGTDFKQAIDFDIRR